MRSIWGFLVAGFGVLTSASCQNPGGQSDAGNVEFFAGAASGDPHYRVVAGQGCAQRYYDYMGCGVFYLAKFPLLAGVVEIQARQEKWYHANSHPTTTTGLAVGFLPTPGSGRRKQWIEISSSAAPYQIIVYKNGAVQTGLAAKIQQIKSGQRTSRLLFKANPLKIYWVSDNKYRVEARQGAKVLVTLSRSGPVGGGVPNYFDYDFDVTNLPGDWKTRISNPKGILVGGVRNCHHNSITCHNDQAVCDNKNLFTTVKTNGGRLRCGNSPVVNPQNCPQSLVSQLLERLVMDSSESDLGKTVTVMGVEFPSMEAAKRAKDECGLDEPCLYDMKVRNLKAVAEADERNFDNFEKDYAELCFKVKFLQCQQTKCLKRISKGRAAEKCQSDRSCAGFTYDGAKRTACFEKRPCKQDSHHRLHKKVCQEKDCLFEKAYSSRLCLGKAGVKRVRKSSQCIQACQNKRTCQVANYNRQNKVCRLLSSCTSPAARANWVVYKCVKPKQEEEMDFDSFY